MSVARSAKRWLAPAAQQLAPRLFWRRRFRILQQLGRSRPDIQLVASLCDVMNSRGKVVRGPEIWRLLRKSCLSPFPHGSIMIRRELFDAIGGYRDRCEFWEDLDLVNRASAASRILVLPEALYCYRQSPTSTRLASRQDRVERAIDLRYRVVDRLKQRCGYDDLLDAGPLQGEQRVDVRVFISLGLLALWSGRRQNVLRRFFKRARLGFNAISVIAIIWVLWTRISPRTLRAVMNLLSKLRNCSVRTKPPLNRPFEWRTPRLLATHSGQEAAYRAETRSLPIL